MQNSLLALTTQLLIAVFIHKPELGITTVLHTNPDAQKMCCLLEIKTVAGDKSALASALATYMYALQVLSKAEYRVESHHCSPVVSSCIITIAFIDQTE